MAWILYHDCTKSYSKNGQIDEPFNSFIKHYEWNIDQLDPQRLGSSIQWEEEIAYTDGNTVHSQKPTSSNSDKEKTTSLHSTSSQADSNWI